MNFIDEHRVRFGVEPICRVLTEHGVKIAPSTYYAFKTRAISQRTVRDQELREHIERVFWDRTKGRGISGARKVWRLLKRDGVVTARCTVERLMRAQGLRGVRRGKQFVTTRPDPAANRAPDHVKRNFRAECPNELWVVDFTYVPTWSGMASTAFVTDVFSRRIVGWRTTNRMPTELPLDALEMALWVRSRAGENIDSVIHHSDELELATLSWVHWFNDNRLHSSIGYLTPIEKEDLYYRENTPHEQPLLGEPALH